MLHINQGAHINEAENEDDFKKNARRAIMNAHAMRRKTVTAKLNGDEIIKLAKAADLRDMLNILQEMKKMQAGENKPESSVNSTPSLKLKPGGSCSLTDSESWKHNCVTREVQLR